MDNKSSFPQLNIDCHCLLKIRHSRIISILKHFQLFLEFYKCLSALRDKVQQLVAPFRLGFSCTVSEKLIANSLWASAKKINEVFIAVLSNWCSWLQDNTCLTTRLLVQTWWTSVEFPSVANGHVVLSLVTCRKNTGPYYLPVEMIHTASYGKNEWSTREVRSENLFLIYDIIRKERCVFPFSFVLFFVFCSKLFVWTEWMVAEDGGL